MLKVQPVLFCALLVCAAPACILSEDLGSLRVGEDNPEPDVMEEEDADPTDTPEPNPDVEEDTPEEPCDPTDDMCTDSLLNPDDLVIGRGILLGGNLCAPDDVDHISFFLDEGEGLAVVFTSDDPSLDLDLLAQDCGERLTGAVAHLDEKLLLFESVASSGLYTLRVSSATEQGSGEYSLVVHRLAVEAECGDDRHCIPERASDNTSGLCEDSRCNFDCAEGFEDRNDNMEADGCEFTCLAQNPLICDSEDLDCDGSTTDGCCEDPSDTWVDLGLQGVAEDITFVDGDEGAFAVSALSDRESVSWVVTSPSGQSNRFLELFESGVEHSQPRVLWDGELINLFWVSTDSECAQIHWQTYLPGPEPIENGGEVSLLDCDDVTRTGTRLSELRVQTIDFSRVSIAWIEKTETGQTSISGAVLTVGAMVVEDLREWVPFSRGEEVQGLGLAVGATTGLWLVWSIDGNLGKFIHFSGVTNQGELNPEAQGSAMDNARVPGSLRVTSANNDVLFHYILNGQRSQLMGFSTDADVLSITPRDLVFSPAGEMLEASLTRTTAGILTSVNIVNEGTSTIEHIFNPHGGSRDVSTALSLGDEDATGMVLAAAGEGAIELVSRFVFEGSELQLGFFDATGMALCPQRP